MASINKQLYTGNIYYMQNTVGSDPEIQSGYYMYCDLFEQFKVTIAGKGTFYPYVRIGTASATISSVTIQYDNNSYSKIKGILWSTSRSAGGAFYKGFKNGATVLSLEDIPDSVSSSPFTTGAITTVNNCVVIGNPFPNQIATRKDAYALKDTSSTDLRLVTKLYAENTIKLNVSGSYGSNQAVKFIDLIPQKKQILISDILTQIPIIAYNNGSTSTSTSDIKYQFNSGNPQTSNYTWFTRSKTITVNTPTTVKIILSSGSTEYPFDASATAIQNWIGQTSSGQSVDVTWTGSKCKAIWRCSVDGGNWQPVFEWNETTDTTKNINYSRTIPTQTTTYQINQSFTFEEIIYVSLQRTYSSEVIPPTGALPLVAKCALKTTQVNTNSYIEYY